MQLYLHSVALFSWFLAQQLCPWLLQYNLPLGFSFLFGPQLCLFPCPQPTLLCVCLSFSLIFLSSLFSSPTCHPLSPPPPSPWQYIALPPPPLLCSSEHPKPPPEKPGVECSSPCTGEVSHSSLLLTNKIPSTAELSQSLFPCHPEE